MNFDELQERLGFTAEDKARFIEFHNPADPERAWQDKLLMHAYPTRAPSVYVMPAYRSPVTGKWIESPSQRRDDLARSGSRPWEGMEQETKVAQKRAAEAEKQADQAIENAVVQAWQSLPSEKRKVLESAA